MVTNEPQWHPEVILDAEDARNWYTERSPLAARGFLLALDDAVKTVLESPERWPPRSNGCRYYIFPSRYSYTLVYRLGQNLEVVAVSHQRRRPEYWKHR
jgi:plasmid stabilization system protein ParE